MVFNPIASEAPPVGLLVGLDEPEAELFNGPRLVVEMERAGKLLSASRSLSSAWKCGSAGIFW